MHWLKRDMWEVGIALVGLLLLLVLMVWVPMSAAYAQRLATQGIVQTTPTVDLTVTALTKEQLALQVKLLQNQLQNQNNWLANNSTALIAAVATVIVALFGISQWAINRRDERRKERDAQNKESNDQKGAQDKDLRSQAEERFKTAVTALGGENEATQVGGAILLRSFLNKEDEEIYGRYYTQIFDLAVAYLRLPSTTQLPEDPDGLSPALEHPSFSLPLTPLRQTLIMIFGEVFPLARERLRGLKGQFDPRLLDASRIRLDGSYLARIHLEKVWFREAYLIGANLHGIQLQETDLIKADLSHADLDGADLSNAKLREAKLYETILKKINLMEANLSKADLRRVDLTDANLEEADLTQATLVEADLTRANFTEANLTEVNLAKAKLTDTNLTKATLAGRNRSAWSSNPAANLEKAVLVRVNLTEANLKGVNLTGAYFSGVEFTGALLREANLTDATLKDAELEGIDLQQAKLTGADLENTNLKGADLESAKFEGANLIRVNLEGANLKWGNLTKTNLRGANLIGADLTYTNIEEAQLLQGTDLHGVKGLTKEQLEACKARGAIVDEDAIVSSLQGVPSPPTPSPTSEPPVPPMSTLQSS